MSKVSERIVCLLSDNPNSVSGAIKAQESGNFDIAYVVSSSQKNGERIQSFTDIPQKNILILSPDDPKFEDRLLTRLTIRGVTDVGQHDFAHQVSDDLIRKFSGRYFRQTDVNPSLFPGLSDKTAYQAAIEFTRQSGGIEDNVRSVIERVSLTEYGQAYWWFYYVPIKATDNDKTLKRRCFQSKIDTTTEFYLNINNLPKPSRVTKREYLNGYEMKMLCESCPQPLLLRAVI